MKTTAVIISSICVILLIATTIFIVIRPRMTKTDGLTPGTQSQQSPPSITIDKSEEAQAGRWNLINSLCGLGVFKEVSDTEVAKVIVGPRFGTTNFLQRQSYAEVVWGACYEADDYNNLAAIVSFHDPETGEELGTYHPRLGLHMK